MVNHSPITSNIDGGIKNKSIRSHISMLTNKFQISNKNIKNQFVGLIVNFGYNVFVLILFYMFALLIYNGAHSYAGMNKNSNNNKIIYETLGGILYYLIVTAGILYILVKMGFHLNTLAVIIGSVGLTVGLALKDSISNISSGVMILLLDYYDIGDLIQINDYIGYIESFNLFVTTIKDLNGVSIKIPNNTITEGVLTNYYKNKDIYFSFNISISNSEKNVKIDEICAKIKAKIISDCKYVSNPEKVLVIVIDMEKEGTRLEIFVPVNSEDYVATKWSIQTIVHSVISENNLNLLDYYYKDNASTHHK